MRIVTPYRPFVPEAHPEAPAFDWLDALRMLNVSAEVACGVRITVLTDTTTAIPDTFDVLRYPATTTRLQPWLTEIRLAYLESSAFDTDTILVSPDTLLMGDIGTVFAQAFDLALLVRIHPKFEGQWKAILNTVQWWRHKAKAPLIAFYREALTIALALPEDLQVWGGDTEALRQLLEPITYGPSTRAGLAVYMLSSRTVFQSLTTAMIAQLDAGAPMGRPHAPIFDFKYRRKAHMRQAFDRLFPEAAP
jgi:hypothetical protein